MVSFWWVIGAAVLFGTLGLLVAGLAAVAGKGTLLEAWQTEVTDLEKKLASLAQEVERPSTDCWYRQVGPKLDGETWEPLDAYKPPWGQLDTSTDVVMNWLSELDASHADA